MFNWGEMIKQRRCLCWKGCLCELQCTDWVCVRKRLITGKYMIYVTALEDCTDITVHTLDIRYERYVLYNLYCAISINISVFSYVTIFQLVLCFWTWKLLISIKCYRVKNKAGDFLWLVLGCKPSTDCQTTILQLWCSSWDTQWPTKHFWHREVEVVDNICDTNPVSLLS